MEKIIVNITTYPKRDKYLPICLKNFSNQTLKPDKIILFLSKEEYNPSHLPESISCCIDNNYISEIYWTDKNTKCHKRYELMEENYDAYNVFIDDDFLYPNTYLENLINISKKHSDCINVLYGVRKELIGGDFILLHKYLKEPSHLNCMVGCFVCFPPKTFPLECFQYKEDRDKYVPACDESWLSAWLLKNDIKVFIGDSFKNMPKIIKDSQQEALVKEMLVENNNCVMEKCRQFANAVKIVGIEDKVKKLFPLFDIDKCSSI